MTITWPDAQDMRAIFMLQDHAFTGLAENYKNARPEYPVEMAQSVIEFAIPALKLPGAIVIDVGSGTGISTLSVKEALPAGCSVLGIEPNDDMRAQASAMVSGLTDISFVPGSAEDLIVEDNAATLVTTGQAIQWFDRPKFYDEVFRVLRPGGSVAIFENNRDWRTSPFLDAHETFLETYSIRKDNTHYSRFYRDHPYAQELFRLFGNVVARQFVWTREMSVGEFVTMAESSTQTQRALDRLGQGEGVRMIRANAERHAGANGILSVPYVTELYMAKKSS
jgi:ubiquinone/menaquinone biosynthesis C-methylase UbiE